MKKALSLFLAVALVCPGIFFGRPVKTAALPRLAIVPFFAQAHVAAAEVSRITRELTAELEATARFSLIERAWVKEALLELQYQPDQPCGLECALRLGRHLGARLVVFGAIEESDGIFQLDAAVADLGNLPAARPAAFEAAFPAEEAGAQLKKLAEKIAAFDWDPDLSAAEKIRDKEKAARPSALGQSPAAELAKRRKFPWLAAAGAALLITGFVIYFLSRPKTGRIDIRSTPRGAKVFLDQRDAGVRTNCILKEVSPGIHDLVLELENHGFWWGRIVVERNRTTEIAATLTAYHFEVEAIIGGSGSGNAQFNGIWGIAVDPSDHLYVADTLNHRVQKFASNGAFITKWGTTGTGNGEFNMPCGIAADAAGHVFVSDFYNDRIQKFTSNGTFLATWGSHGSGDSQFNGPSGIAVDGSGNILVADVGNHRLQQFTAEGTFLRKWGGPGVGGGQLNEPFGVSVDSSGNIFVTDTINDTVQKFTSSGTFVAGWGSFGSGNGQFNRPSGLAFDRSGSLYVVDSLNHRIQRFSSGLIFLLKWGSLGSGSGQFNEPCAIAIDSQDHIYVAERANNRIQKFQPLVSVFR